jgi:dsRNA-specific ribonuclease
LVVAEKLFHTFPSEAVGSVAARFAKLVDRETLHQIAVEIQLEQFLSYVHDPERSPGRRSITPLADACEAIIGAIYLDGGLAAASSFVGERWARWIKQDLQPRRDAKSELQEWAQARGLPRPSYREVSRTGPAHLPVFVVEARLEGFSPVLGEGFSKREAEQAVAALLLELVAPRDSSPAIDSQPSPNQ